MIPKITNEVLEGLVGGTFSHFSQVDPWDDTGLISSAKIEDVNGHPCLIIELQRAAFNGGTAEQQDWIEADPRHHKIPLDEGEWTIESNRRITAEFSLRTVVYTARPPGDLDFDWSQVRSRSR